MTGPLRDEQLASWLAFLRLSFAVPASVESLLGREGELTLTEFLVLDMLWRTGTPLRVGDIAEAAALTRSSTSRLLSRLERRNLVERETDPNDARVALVSLRSEGQALHHRVHLPYAARVREVFLQRLDSDQLAAIRDIAATVQPQWANPAVTGTEKEK